MYKYCFFSFLEIQYVLMWRSGYYGRKHLPLNLLRDALMNTGFTGAAGRAISDMVPCIK